MAKAYPANLHSRFSAGLGDVAICAFTIMFRISAIKYYLLQTGIKIMNKKLFRK
jgi:hypothetical protein